MNGYSQYFISLAEPSLSDEERAPFDELSDHAYVEVHHSHGRILCRGDVRINIDWQGIMEHLTVIGRDPKILAVTEADGRPRGTEWEMLEDGSRRLVGEAILPIDHAAYSAFFEPYQVEGMPGEWVTVTPAQNTGSGWELPLWDEPIYPAPIGDQLASCEDNNQKN